MTHGSLFSGIGGFDLAAQWVGWENIFQVEIDDFCNKVLEKHFPNVQRFRDIKEFDGTKFRGSINIISGGVPCQPASLAGKRKGKTDNRWLWPEALRILDEIKPAFAIFENPTGLLSLENGRSFEWICREVENIGYQVTTINLPACFVGAWHQRQRIFIVANIKESRIGRLSIQQWRQKETENFNTDWISEVAPDTCGKRLQNWKGSKESRKIRQTINGSNWWKFEPGMVRVVYGVPNRVDRIKSLGNAIVPQVAYEIFKIIDMILTQENTTDNHRGEIEEHIFCSECGKEIEDIVPLIHYGCYICSKCSEYINDEI